MTPPGLRRPCYGGGSLADVLPAVLTALGVPGERRGPTFDPTSRAVVVLVDGLGAAALREHAALAPVLTGLAAAPGSTTITTVFPSTTPIALTSFGTGLTPGEHGLTGLLLRLAGGQVVNTLANPAETDLRALQPQPTGFERAAAAGVEVTRVGPAAFDGQGLTEAALRGGRYAAAEQPDQRVTAALTAVRGSPRALVYVYFGDLDAAGHRAGCRSPAWRAELVRLDRLLDRLLDGLPPDATLVATSDHGMLDSPAGQRVDLARSPVLDQGVETLTGDLRGAQVHVRPGALDDVRAAWRATLGDGFWVAERDEAVEAGLYGPVVRDEVRARLGELLAVPLRDGALLDSRLLPPDVLGMVGLHGGLTAAEVEVPLLVHRAG